MNQEQYEQLKELIADVELKCLIYGRACERYDLNDEYSRYPSLEKYRDSKHQDWGEASDKLHKFLEGFVK